MNSVSKQLIDWKIIAASLWLLFTVTLSIWWIRLGLKYIGPIGPKRDMILSEGITLVLCLAVGGVTIIYYILREKKRYRNVHDFFACANHELKTYVASIRLRAEGLEQDLKEGAYATQAHKIVRDTNRLELQLENSLIFSAPGKKQLFLETIDLKQFIDDRAQHYPDMDIQIKGAATIQADQRMLDIIIKNILQNTLIHAQASHLTITIDASPQVSVLFTNDGKPFQGKIKKLGMMFYRHDHQSRSGIGLYLVATLMKSLGGQCTFSLGHGNQLQTKLTFTHGSHHS